MKLKIKAISIIFFIFTGITIAGLPKTVNSINLKRYMGTWYEIASFPAFFQRGCRCTSAHYQLNNSTVKIRNQCYKGRSLSVANGKAWSVNPPYNSKLKVQFFWPFSGDYWILYISRHYRQVIVGSPNRKYLWILSRARHMRQSLYKKLVNIALHKGYDVSQLRITDQDCNSK